MRVLLVEDEERRAQNLATILRVSVLFAVDFAPDGSVSREDSRRWQ